MDPMSRVLLEHTYHALYDAEIPRGIIAEGGGRSVGEGTALPGDRVVISGISGAYPASRNIKDFADILYNKVDPIAGSQPRWNYYHPEVPPHVGMIPDVDRFDAQFFGVHYRLVVNMDPMSRVLLEHTYQALYDAGVNPQQLSGRNIGVYVGSCLSETEKTGLYNEVVTGFGMMGCNKAMYANRVSYWLNIKGPSQAIDAACCSSAVALEQAFQAMRRGVCEAAIVVGCNLCLHPQTSVHFSRSIKLCNDGKTKSYDQAADGCVRSEAVSVMFLQKATDALRIYAEVVHVKSKYVSKEYSGSFKRKPEETIEFLKEFYDEIKVSPSEVEYIEGFGAADPDCDKTELEALDKVFCQGRREPLPVGSVMSNVGYCESATGIIAITKVVLGYHTGRIAGNLHCSRPLDAPSLRARRLAVLADHATSRRGFVAVNGLSLTGVNSHVLLHGRYKPKDLTKYQSSIPRIVLLSGRTDSVVKNMINDLKSRPIDAEELALLQNFHSYKVNGHLGRGFTVLDTDSSGTISLSERADYFDRAAQPLWFVYSGMGSQWATMGAQLMRLPIFAAAIERCHRVLEPKGIDIVHIITSPEKTVFDNILHSFVGIAAVQIGLTDILYQLGLVPDKIIGHSVGELGCAYADGCLTAEEMILSAYARGQVSVETPFIRGSMAAVGVGYEKISKMCPPEIEVACHNSPNSSTISGPAEAMAQFVAQLSAQRIFAKEVPCSNIAYHSRYIAEAGPGLLKYLKEVIKTPKLRSKRWISTSVPQDRWDEDISKYSSAEYHTNNLLSPVLLEEVLPLVPAGAVLVEVAPHGLLQAILTRALPKCSHVPLTRRQHPHSARLLLEAIGQLYMEGFYPDIRPLYPKVEFPVSTGTPHLSHLVEWAHDQKWYVALYKSPNRIPTSTCTFKITLHDDEHSYLRGHRIRGKTLFPFASALVCAWDTLCMCAGAPRRAAAARLCDVLLNSQPTMHDSRLLQLTVALCRGTGRFEINDDITKVASGTVILVKTLESTEDEPVNEYPNKAIERNPLEADEIYRIFNERGCAYSDEFRTLREAHASLTAGVVRWGGRWEPFLDGLIQMHSLRQPRNSSPAFIRELSINTDLHPAMVQMDEDLKVTLNTVQERTRCGGVTMRGIKFRHIVSDSVTSKLDPIYQDANCMHGEKDEVDQKENTALRPVDTSASEGSGIWVKVHYAGLNASDVFKKDYQHGEGIFGLDFSGTTENGTRVMGLSRGAARGRLRARPELLWPAPAHWSLEDAATVPFPYAHALYCLAIKTQLLPRSTVLVDGGAGATGQAVISLSLHADCRVFVIVGDVAKKQFLMKVFPELNADDIICCRDDSFMNRVMSATEGAGCDYVIYSRSEHNDTYLKCCAPCGYTLGILHEKMKKMFSFGMSALFGERSHGFVDFSSLFLNDDIETLKKLQRLLAEGISGGWVRPLTRVVYGVGGEARALRLLARSRHRGRVLLRFHHTPTDIAVEAVEQASQRRQPVIHATPLDCEDSLVQKINTITGVLITETTAGSQTLRDLGLAEEKVQALCLYLRDKQNISITEEEAPLLTVERIREMEAILKESDYAPLQGLSAFFPSVDPDELSTSIEAVVMPTLTQPSDMRGDEFEGSAATLYIIPGMQGLQQRYRQLCERLQLAAVVLQPGLEPGETIHETTARYVKTILRSKTAETSTFYLLGHEWGVLCVLEIAAALEDLGMVGTVFCLGGGPDELQQELERHVRAACAGDSEHALQQAVARHMCALMGVEGPQLDEELRGAETWGEVVGVSVRALRGRVAHSTQYARSLIEAAYARVTQARRSREMLPPRALQSRLVLLRSPPAGAPQLNQTPHPLQRCTRQPLIVHELRAPLAHAPTDLRAAAIVNRYLDDHTKQCFASKSLCHTYLTNSDSFIYF